VSDFGLTKLREDVTKGGDKDIAGSLHWTAPEVLNESAEVDWILSDVYRYARISLQCEDTTPQLRSRGFSN
jgi:hypothetical protein